MTMGTPNNRSNGNSIQPAKELSPNQVVDLIMSAALFQDMNPEDVAVLARFLSLHDVAQGAVMFQEGDTSDYLGLIIDGVVELFKDGPSEQKVKIGSESAGRVLGEMGLIDGEPRSATARFTQSGQVLILTRESFQRLLREHPRSAANFLFRLSRLLSRRLRKTTGMLASCLSERS